MEPGLRALLLVVRRLDLQPDSRLAPAAARTSVAGSSAIVAAGLFVPAEAVVAAPCNATLRSILVV